MTIADYHRYTYPMNYPTLRHGLVRIPEYQTLLADPLFNEIERFSDQFISKNKAVLASYGTRWVSDPLHQWSRQWEYPFVFVELAKFIDANKRKPVTVLDAGSGITFFPYLLRHKFDNVCVRCVDTDKSLAAIHSQINQSRDANLEFTANDIGNIDAPAESCDVIYCISVLEHTKNYQEIIKEFSRLLRPHGQLILTFDISLDGNADIPVDRAKQLLKTLNQTFRAVDEASLVALIDSDPYFSSDVLTTEYIKQYKPALLPWRHPRLSGALASISKGRFPRFAIKKLGFACHTFEKRA